jgi:hypothetical protein
MVGGRRAAEGGRTVSSTALTPTLTMQDIADLARVRRSTVSMWRNRPMARGQLLPFPEPLASKDGVEQFGREEIVDWLERSGRGNNHEHRLDAPALSPPAGMSLEDLVTLLCLRVHTGQELTETTAVERESGARECDPDDAFMLREIAAATTTKDTLRFIDDLVEASYGAGEALDRLENGRLGRSIGARDLTSGAVDLVRTVAKACGLHIDSEGVSLVHVGGSPMLALALGGDFAHLVVPGDGVEQRALRRRAAICGIETSVDAVGPCVRILSVVGCKPDNALDAIDEIMLGLGKSDVAVALGPASMMCDELRGGQEQKRAHTLRPGNLMLAMRLPRGMWREAHRQALGLWICAGGMSTFRPLVVDFAAFIGHEVEAGDLAADVAGALARSPARAFRYARPRDLQQVLSTHALVPRGARALQLGTTDVAPHLNRIHAATLVTGGPVQSFDVLAAAAPGSMILRRRSMGEIGDLKQVQVRRGSRIDAGHANPAGTVAVLSAADDAEEIRLDPFDAARLYPRAARTEPGDVVFVEKPRPSARVDDRGGSLVASPSKIFRLSPAVGVGPHAVAAIINQLPDEANEWPAWSVPILDAAAAKQLEDVLIAAAGYEASLRRRLGAVRDLIEAMIDGVAAGAVTLKPQTEQ